MAKGTKYSQQFKEDWSYVKKKYKLNVTNFLCSEGIVKFFV